ncbi:MAG: tetratricopeptide repeat protein [Sulfurifustaceae bacterium]
MMKTLLAGLLALVVLAGCVSAPPSGSGPEPLPVASDNNAVVALVRSARDEAAAGRLNAAASQLERALRIEPRNPALWHELARLRLHQGEFEQAAQCATKSNSLAGDKPQLRASNWRLIGQARTESGDQAGAELAFARAAEIENRR